MAHDVFISHSSKDKPIADAICAHLEGAGVRCWIAPRDIAPGEDWPTAITRAISQSRVMVLVFSAHSNSSEDVSRELFLAANSKLVIIPFKIENIEPEPGKQYYLARTHWLDAINPPTQEQIRALIDCVKALLPVRETPPIVEIQPATPPREEQSVRVSEPPKLKQTPKKKVAWVRFLWIPGILMVFLCLAVLYVLTFVTHTIALPGARATATAKIPATSAPIPDFTAKVGMTGVDLYSGPGENYSKIDFVFTDHVTIIGQAYSCAWLKVTAESSSGPEYGWVSADKVTYTVKCSDIPAVEVSSTPMPTIIPKTEAVHGMAGKWLDPDTTGTYHIIAWQNGKYVLTETRNPNRGGNEVTSSTWANGMLTWTYCVPGGACVTTKTVSVSGNSLYTNWSNDQGQSGSTTMQRMP